MKLVSGVLLIVVFLRSEAAIACRMTCVLPEPRLVAAEAKLLFRGRLKRILTESDRETTPFELVRFECCRGILEFETLDVWKGDVPSKFSVMVTFQNGVNCGRIYYAGEEYVLWSFKEAKEDQLPIIANCHGIGRGGWPVEASIDAVTFARALGPPK